MTVTAIVYTAAGVERYDDFDAAVSARGTTWLRVVSPTTDELAALREATGVHPLSVEDVQNNVRPKLEEFETHTFVLAKEATLAADDVRFRDKHEERPVGLFVGDDWLVTLAPDEPAAVEDVWRVVLRADARVLARGPDFAAYRVFDGLVDGYYDLLDEIEDRIERVEEDVVRTPDRETLLTINAVRRDLLSVRKVLWPSREVAGVLARGDPETVREPTEKYFRDVYDHLVQIVDLTETYRDLASGARDVYLNVLSQSTNEVMKRLTVVATIVLPLTLVVGVYGMNFGDSPYNMPELAWTYGYPAVVLGMAAIAATMLVYFRREGWL